ncbi:MAG TPA: hypothetical protein VNN79_04355 [Actinomycetota bacterium]|nr:hypothetical protein [Actinomycetota bacterium]
MSVVVLTNAQVTVNGVDLSDHVDSVEVQTNVDDVDITAMGASAHQHAPGLRNDKITVNFLQDFAAGKVDATLFPLLGNTGFTVKVVPVATTVSTTNPSYTATCVLFTYNPLSGKVGERSDTSVEFQATGLVVKATT